MNYSNDDTALEFDYIIVGSGASAAGFLNGFLRSGSKDTIAVIERGSATDHQHPSSTAPHRWPDAAFNNNGVLYQATVGGSHKKMEIAVGKGLGGSTNVNACLLVPPAAEDFSTWPLPWKREMMSNVANVQDQLTNNDSLLEFHTTVKEMLTVDTATQAKGLWQSPLSVRKDDKGVYKRVSFHDGLVRPHLQEIYTNNLTWFLDTNAERLLLKGRQVIGVECSKAATHNTLFKLIARKEVIVSAGAIETPALLLASGIGMDDDMKAAKIPSVGCNIPVGHNLMDHIMLPRIFLHPFTSHDLSPATVQALYNTKDGDDRFQFMLSDSASSAEIMSLLIFGGNHMKLLQTSPTVFLYWANFLIRPCVVVAKFALWFTLTCTPVFYLGRYFSFGTNIVLLNPKSRGRVFVTRNSRTSSPGLDKGPPFCRRSDVSIHVDSCYLTDERDISTMRKAWTKSSECLVKWFQRGTDLISSSVLENESSFAAHTRKMCSGYYHWCGTCAIGTVLDNELRVKGMQNLRVCDASSFATIPSGPTGLTCAALGFGLSRMIFGDDKKGK